MPSNIPKYRNAWFVALKRFPIAWIALLLYAVWFLFGDRILGYREDSWDHVFWFFVFLFAVYPILFWNIAFRLRAEAGHPVKPWSQVLVYLFAAACPFPIWFSGVSGLIVFYGLLLIFGVIFVPPIFILPFCEHPNAGKSGRLTKRVLIRFLIACLIAVSLFLVLNFPRLNHFGDALDLIFPWPDSTSIFCFLFLLPGLFLILMPTLDLAPEVADGEDADGSK